MTSVTAKIGTEEWCSAARSANTYSRNELSF